MQQVTNGGHRSSSSTHPPSQFHLSHPHHSRSESKTLTAPPATVMPNALMSTTNVTPCPQPQQSSSSSNTDPTGSRLSNGQMGAAGIVSPALPTSTCSTGLSGTPGDHSSTLGITEHTSSGQTLHIQCGFCTGTCRIDVSLLTASEWTALTSPDRHKGIQWKCSDCQQRNPLLSIEQQLQSMSQQLLALISTVDTLVTTCAQRNSQLYANVSVTDVENSIPVNFCRPPPTSAPLNSTIMSSNNKSRALRTLPLDFTPIIDKKAMGGCNIGHSQPSYLLNNHIQIQQAQQNLNAIVDITNDGSESVYSDPAEVIEAMPQHVHIYMDSGDDASAAQYSSDRVISGREARLLLQTPVLCPDHEKNTNRLQSRNQSLHLLSNNLSIDANRPNTLKSQSCDDQSHHHHHHYTTTSTATASTPPLDPNTEPELEQILHCRLIIPPPSIPLKEYLPCVLSHIESPNEFYVHVTDEEVNNAIDDLSEQLSNCYGNGREYPFSSIPNHMLTEKLLGRYLAAFYPTDQNWYRVRVLHVHPNLRTCTVQYVDYGNTEQLSVDDLNYLRPELADTPELAIRCSLAYVQPPTDQDEVGKWIEPNGWSEEQTLCFQGVSGFDREQVVTAHVLEVTTTPLMKVDVLLWNNSGPEGSGSRDVLINLWMVRQGMAHSDRFELLEEVERCANQSLNAPAFFESEADTISSDPPNHPPPPLPSIVVRTPPLLQTPSRSKSPPPPPPASAPIDTKAPDCPDSPIRGQWSSLDASNFRSDYSKVDVPSVGCLPPFIAPYPTHQLKIGRTVFMKITHADSPHQFYGVLPFGSVSYDRVNVETEKQLMERLKAAPESLKYRELCLQMKYNNYYF